MPVVPVPQAVASFFDRPATTLTTAEAEAMLAAFGIPLAAGRVVADRRGAASTSVKVGFPVVMKIASADFPHKSDFGLVTVGIRSSAEAEEAFDALTRRAAEVNPEANVEGVLIQRQLTGVELIVGVINDPVFGPAVMVGLGGVFAELIRDTAIRPLPLDRGDIDAMLRSLRGFPVLSGFRGGPAVDIERLIDFVGAVARLAKSSDGRLQELDLNPVLASGAEVVAVDALIVAGTTDLRSS
jgi:acetate---CoA ligase (ADP-forming)